MVNFKIDAYWDDEANVWVASSEGELGLVTEAESLDTLLENIRELVPELIELNGLEPDTTPLELSVHAGQQPALACA